MTAAAPTTLDAITTGVATPPDLVPPVEGWLLGGALLPFPGPAAPAAVPGFSTVGAAAAGLVVLVGAGLTSLNAGGVWAGDVGTALASVWLVPGANGGVLGTVGNEEDEDTGGICAGRGTL